MEPAPPPPQESTTASVQASDQLQDAQGGAQEATRQFELLIYVPNPPFLTSKSKLKSSSPESNSQNDSDHYNVLSLPVLKADILHDLKQMIYDSVDGYWLGAIGFHKVSVAQAPSAEEGENDNPAGGGVVPVPKFTGEIDEPVAEYSEFSSIFPDDEYSDLTIRRAVKVVPASYNASDSRSHLLRVKDILTYSSPALQPSKYFRAPPYDPSSFAIDAGLSLFSDVRQQSSNPQSQQREQSPSAETADGEVYHASPQSHPTQRSKSNKKRGGRSSKSSSGKQQPKQQQQRKVSQNDATSEKESDEHAFTNYNHTSPNRSSLTHGSSAGNEAFTIAEQIQNLKNTPQAPICLKSLSLSHWNPVPHHLRVRGQLLYVSALTLEGEQLHITSTSQGYYVDKSDSNHLDTTPRQSKKNNGSGGNDIVYINIFSLLCAYSPLFKSTLNELLTPNPSFEPLMTVPPTNCVPAYPWLVNPPKHSPNALRMQSAYLLTGSTNADTLPPSRDWNEELVQIKELPKANGEERLLRDRVLARYYADFANSAARTVPAIIRGDIPPLNPNEAKELATCIHNNTLFTPAEDALNVYPHLGGHEAARVVVTQDLAGIKQLNAFDIDKVNLMATAVVDYHGERWLAQSLVPGIFNRQPEEENVTDVEKKKEDNNSSDGAGSFKIVYGNLDTENPDEAHVADPDFHQLASQIAEKANLSLHTVTDSKGRNTELYTSADSHGVTGSDGRNYLIDVFRLHPVDVEFLENDVEKKPIGYPDENAKNEIVQYPHRMTFLRPELLNAYRDQERRKWVTKITEEKVEKEKREKGQGLEKKKENSVAKNDDKNEKVGQDSNDDDDETRKMMANAAESIDMNDFKLNFNVDAFVQRKAKDNADHQSSLANSGGNNNNNNEDEDEGTKAVREASKFLRETIIPTLLREVASSGTVYGDDTALSKHFHNHGINIRYLGFIADQIDKFDFGKNLSNGSAPDAQRNLQAYKEVIIRGMICRSAKHLFRKILRKGSTSNSALVSAHFLNCLLDSDYEKLNPYVNINKKKAEVDDNNSWKKLTPTQLRQELSEEILRRYRYYITVDDLIPNKLARVQLLRQVCLSVGIQILLKKYEFGPRVNVNSLVNGSASEGKKSAQNEINSTGSSSNRPTFEEIDIMNVYPIVKGTPHKSSLAEEIMEQGSICFVRGHLELGERLTSEAINFYEQVYGNVHPEVASQFHALGIVYHQLAQPLSRKIGLYQASQAESQQRSSSSNQEELSAESKRLRTESGIENDEQFASAQRELHFYLESAVRMNRQSVIIAERTLGLDHPDTIQQYADLGILEHAVGDVKVGLTFTKHAIDLWNITYGLDHPDTTRRLNNAAQMIQGWKGYGESIPLLTEAYNSACRSRGDDSLLAGNALYNLTQAQCLSGDFQNGRESASKAAKVFRERVGPEDEKTKETENLVAVIEQAATDWARDAEVRASRVARRLGLDAGRAAELLSHSSTSNRRAGVTSSGGANANGELLRSASASNRGTNVSNSLQNTITKASEIEKDPSIGSKGHLDVAELVSYIEGGSATATTTTTESSSKGHSSISKNVRRKGP